MDLLLFWTNDKLRVLVTIVTWIQRLSRAGAMRTTIKWKLMTLTLILKTDKLDVIVMCGDKMRKFIDRHVNYFEKI